MHNCSALRKATPCSTCLNKDDHSSPGLKAAGYSGHGNKVWQAKIAREKLTTVVKNFEKDLNNRILEKKMEELGRQKKEKEEFLPYIL